MPDVQSARNLPHWKSTGKWIPTSGSQAGKVKWTSAEDYQRGSQTTFSYRSGRGYDERAMPDLAAFSQDSGSQLGFMRELAKESRGDFGRDRNYDNGHEFWTDKTEFLFGSNVGRNVSFKSKSWGDWELVGGSLFPCSPSYIQAPTTFSLPTQTQINVDGAKLIRMTTPTKAEAGLAQFLGELREGLPRLVGAQTVARGISAHSVGHEYLNTQFGIKPFVNDIQKFARSVTHVSKTVNQMRRDSETSIRRRASLGGGSSSVELTPVSSNVALTHYSSQDFSPQIWSYQPPLTRVVETTTSEVWFSGAYTYYLHQAENFLGKLEMYEQLANKLLGTRFDVDTFWQLTPWSWLIDWFADFNTFFSNVSALSNDSLVLRYGYVMHTNSAVRTYTKSGLMLQSGASAPTAVTSIVTRVHKSRYRATPYGFGLDVQAFSPTRWAILGALGLTKSPNTLR